MKKLPLFLVPPLAVIGWFAWPAARDRAESSPVSATVIWQGEPPTLTVTDAEEIFKKAFWRRPAADDEILHAVRHEWRDEGGLLRWQWFLVVKGSPGFIKYLREDNSFGLAPATSSSLIPEAPAWFRFDPAQVLRLQSPQSALHLVFSKHDSTIYATASGRGFTRGIPEPLHAVQSAPSRGRIPITPPPRPK